MSSAVIEIGEKRNRKIAILQPNYIPWKGVFDLINRVEVFVFFDDVQYTAKDWRNRNKIKTKDGDIWLTVPVKTKGLRDQKICEAHIDTTSKWQENHYKTIKNAYKNAKFYKEYEYLLEQIYIEHKWELISDLNIFSTKLIADALGISVQWELSSKLNIEGSKDGERAIKICKALDCNYFINGPASKAFMNASLFEEHKIHLTYIDYEYKEYTQLYKPFNHQVSIFDVLFNCGDDAKELIFKRG